MQKSWLDSLRGNGDIVPQVATLTKALLSCNRFTLAISVFAKKLREGDEIRVVAPSLSLSIISKDVRKTAVQRFERMGFNVSFGAHVEETDLVSSSSIKSRVADIHEAFGDPHVKAVFAVIGGWNANQILRYLDFGLIRSNPKIFCGYSDITALNNAMLAKSGLVTYSGPCFSSFGMVKGFDYTLDYFRRCLVLQKPFKVEASEYWSNDKWYKDQENRRFIKNEGHIAINNGTAEGRVIGGNLCTFNLLQGTEYMPRLKNSILLIEDDEETNANIFDRDLQSLIHQPGFDSVRGMIIGRFENLSNITDDALARIIKGKKELDHMPVIANVECSHTSPIATLPIGGTAMISAEPGRTSIEVVRH